MSCVHPSRPESERELPSLPAIAQLPLALLWFGLGQGSRLFVLVQAVLWPSALSMSGFQGVPGGWWSISCSMYSSG
jgi:ABC-type nitrate/sulfonate/bicarbonate transport system permease component